MRKLWLALLLLASPAWGQAGGAATTVGGMTTEVCANPTVSTSPYTTAYNVGGLLTLTPVFRSPSSSGAPDAGGVLQSIRINIKSAQTATFKAYEFSSNPSSSTFTNNAAVSINAADVFKAHGPILLANPDSGLGTMTVYNADAIGRAHISANASDYWVIVVTGTPTFSSATGFQFCATYLVD